MTDGVLPAGPKPAAAARELPPTPVFGRRLTRRLLAIERKLGDLKPSFWKTTLGDALKIAVTAGATLWATYLTGKLNQQNVLIGARANAEAAERIKDFREVRREWAQAKSTFLNYFINAENAPQLPPAQEFMKADLNLLRQIETASIPSKLAEHLEEFRKAAGTAKSQCEEAKTVPERQALAKAARLSLEQKKRDVSDAFDQAQQDKIK